MATTAVERIGTLDTVRGVAVMGILLLNIVGFGMPEVAYMNPRAFGGWQGADLIVYLINFILFDGKMRGLFSFLFGASLLLVVRRAEEKGEDPARVHFRRMLVLLGFGLVHLWLIWWGDILAHYALVGMVAFLFRDMAPRKLIVWGIGLVLLETLLVSGVLLGLAAAGNQIASGDAAQIEAGRDMIASFQKGFGTPSIEYLADEVARMRSGYGTILAHRFDQTWHFPLSALLQLGPETLAYMLFGMAAFRSGLLSGAWTRRRYATIAATGFGIALPCYALLAWHMVDRGFAMEAVVLGTLVGPSLVRPFAILGWACLIILLAKPGGRLTVRVAAVGRMAFTNYLATSVLCTTFFYGYGLARFGTMSRAELYIVVIAIWALMLLWSKPWLNRHRYGPMEWLWRSLARGERQGMRGAAAN